MKALILLFLVSCSIPSFPQVDKSSSDTEVKLSDTVCEGSYPSTEYKCFMGHLWDRGTLLVPDTGLDIQFQACQCPEHTTCQTEEDSVSCN